MKVYVTEREYDYEGFQIIGIFETKEEAKMAIKGDQVTDYGDSWRIETFEVGVSDHGTCDHVLEFTRVDRNERG